MRLGTLLLRDAVVNLSQLEAALHSQVLYGGRLGTHLVALGFLGLDTLSSYLGEMLGSPFATQRMFEAVDPRVVAEFDPALAEHCEAFPLGYLSERPDTLAVALANPRDHEVLARLARELDRPLALFVAPELRIRDYVQRHYGIVPRPRSPSSQEVAEQARADEATGTTDAGEDSGQGARALRPGTARPATPPSQGAPLPEPRTPVSVQSWSGPSLSHGEAAVAMEQAVSRNEVGDALLGFAAGVFEAAVVFLLRRGDAVPWRVHALPGHAAAATMDALALPLGKPSVLQVAYERGEVYRGRAPCAGQSVERTLWKALGVAREPGEVLVAPVLLEQRVVNLIYAHGPGGEALDPAAVEQLVDLAERAADRYTQLIRAGRQAEGSAAARSVPHLRAREARTSELGGG